VLAKPLAVCTHLSSTVSQLSEPQVQKIAVFMYRSPHFCFPWTQYVAWMERQFNACQTPRSMYLSIFNSFPVIRTASAKNRCFHVLQPKFLFPLETPLRLSRNMLHVWKECLQHVSIFNSFRVIRCLSQCVTPKIVIFTTFLFPLGTPLAQSR